MKNKITIAVYLALTAVPLLSGVVYIILYSLGLTGLISEGFTLAYWKQAFESTGILASMLYSLWIALATIATSITIALLFVFLYRPKEQIRIPYYLFLPLSIPYMVMGFFSFQLLSGSGMLSRISYHMGFTASIGEFPGLINDSFGFGIIFSHVFLATPFFIIMFLTIYQNERLAKLMEISSSIGVNFAYFYRKVAMPVIIRKAIPFLMIYTIVFAGSYEIPLLLGVQSPEMIAVFIVRKLQKFNLMDIPVAYVATIIYAALVILMVLVYTQLYLRKEIAND